MIHPTPRAALSAFAAALSALALSACGVHPTYAAAPLVNPGAALRVPVTLGPRVAIRESACDVARHRALREYHAARTMYEVTDWRGTTRSDDAEGDGQPPPAAGAAVRDVAITVDAAYSPAQSWVPRAPEDRGTALAFLATLSGALAGHTTSDAFRGTIRVDGRVVEVAPPAGAPCARPAATAGGAP